LEEVSVRAGHKVLMEVVDNILPIVRDPQGSVDQKVKPRPTYALIIIIIITSDKYIKLNILNYSTGDHPI
jgi:hypothetical protein